MSGNENFDVIQLTKDNYEIYKNFACVYLSYTSPNYQGSVEPFELMYNKPYIVKYISNLGNNNLEPCFIITNEKGVDTKFYVTRFCVRKVDLLFNKDIFTDFKISKDLEKHLHGGFIPETTTPITDYTKPTTGLNPKDLVGAKKVNVDCVPTSAIIETAIVLGLGAKKYGPYNWRDQPIQMVTYINAAIRHLYALLDGEDIDSETGRTHFASVMAGMSILIDAQRVGTLLDNRCKIGTGGTVSLLKELEHYVHPFVTNNPDYNFKDQ